MGWIITTFLLLILCVAISWIAARLIFGMYNKQQQFEDELEERIDDALRILDASFMEIALIANKNVFFDSPEVRAVVTAIQRSRTAVVNVASIFANIDIEDNTNSVTPKITEYVTKEDPHNPKSAEELDKETRKEQIINAVRDGTMEIMEPPKQSLQHMPRVDHRASVVSAAIARRQSRVK